MSVQQQRAATAAAVAVAVAAAAAAVEVEVAADATAAVVSGSNSLVSEGSGNLRHMLLAPASPLRSGGGRGEGSAQSPLKQLRAKQMTWTDGELLQAALVSVEPAAQCHSFTWFQRLPFCQFAQLKSYSPTNQAPL